ncbi:MAG: hypothetical protein V8T12_04065 [Parabacteroides johnsonii]
MGRDRLAAAVGANYLEPGKDLLVIDAEALSYELIDASTCWGNAPGMTTRLGHEPVAKKYLFWWWNRKHPSGRERIRKQPFRLE